MNSRMNSLVWKFHVSPTASTEMPRGAQILHVHEQDGSICVWAEVDPEAPRGSRRLLVVPTGGQITPTAAYVGTVHLEGLAFHIYDGGEAA